MEALPVAPYSHLGDAGSHTLTIPASDIGLWRLWSSKLSISSWNDGSINLSKTVDVEGEPYLSAKYTQSSCPDYYGGME